MKIVGKVLDKLGEGYLPLKFHRKGRIEVEDFLESGFYVISGTWRWDFPLLNEITRYPITDEYTVYLVDYSAHPLFENIDALPYATEWRSQKKIKKCIYITVTQIHNTASIIKCCRFTKALWKVQHLKKAFLG